MSIWSAWFASVQQSFINDFIVDDRWKYIVSGLRITILVTLLSLLIGLVLGIVVAMIRSTHDQTHSRWFKSPGSFLLKLANAVCKLYITVIRGTPTLVQLLIMNFIVLLSSTKITVAVITFGINSGAYVAEIIRGGIMGVDSGQMEAGRSPGAGVCDHDEGYRAAPSDEECAAGSDQRDDYPAEGDFYLRLHWSERTDPRRRYHPRDHL